MRRLPTMSYLRPLDPRVCRVRSVSTSGGVYPGPWSGVCTPPDPPEPGTVHPDGRTWRVPVRYIGTRIHWLRMCAASWSCSHQGVLGSLSAATEALHELRLQAP